jgi:D-glycero-alpha-D-manno-heptose-7-phosphate kinase
LGGLSFIEIDEYPSARVESLRVDEPTWAALGERLVLIYLGRAHESSGVHEAVIRRLEASGGQASELDALRAAARRARDAVLAGDLNGLGEAMRANTAAQQRLHDHLVSPAALRIVEAAREHGAVGWKVNGAGGAGGSLTLLSSPRREERLAMISAIETLHDPSRHIPIALSRTGLRVCEDEIS